MISHQELVIMCRKYKYMSSQRLIDELKRSDPRSLSATVIRKIVKDRKAEQQQIKQIVNSLDVDVDVDNVIDNLLDDTDIQNIDKDKHKDKDKDKDVSKEMLNNNLMNRLNSELDIQRLRREANKSVKEFIPPFAENTGDKFAPFYSSVKQTGPTNFSNKPLFSNR